MKAEHIETRGLRVSDGLSTVFSIKLVFRCNAVNYQLKGWFPLITSSSKLLLQCHLVKWLVKCHGFTKVCFFWLDGWRDLPTETESRTREFTSNSPHFNQKLPEPPESHSRKGSTLNVWGEFLEMRFKGAFRIHKTIITSLKIQDILHLLAPLRSSGFAHSSRIWWNLYLGESICKIRFTNQNMLLKEEWRRVCSVSDNSSLQFRW